MLGVSACFGSGTVYARWARPKQPALIASGQLIIAALVALALSRAFGESWSPTWSRKSMLSVVLLGIFSTALPSVLFLTIISKHKAVKVGAASFLQPVWAIILGFIFLRETIQPIQLVGTVIIIISVIMITVDFDIISFAKGLFLQKKSTAKEP